MVASRSDDLAAVVECCAVQWSDAKPHICAQICFMHILEKVQTFVKISQFWKITNIFDYLDIFIQMFENNNKYLHKYAFFHIFKQMFVHMIFSSNICELKNSHMSQLILYANISAKSIHKKRNQSPPQTEIKLR